MAITTTVFNLFKRNGALPNTLDGHTLKLSLHTSSYTPNLDTHEFYSDLTNELAATGNYATGGETVGIVGESGSGKSTILYMCNSIYGHPKNLASIWKDTYNSKMHRLGVLNNLPNTIDEITNTTAQEFSDLAYSISQGRGKNRMKASTNEMRVNLTSWQGITLASSNASFYEKLGMAKDSPDGESMRLLEYSIVPSTIIPVEVGKKMFDHQLMENYGHAGDIFAEYLVGHVEDVIDLLRQVQALLAPFQERPCAE